VGAVAEQAALLSNGLLGVGVVSLGAGVALLLAD